MDIEEESLDTEESAVAPSQSEGAVSIETRPAAANDPGHLFRFQRTLPLRPRCVEEEGGGRAPRPHPPCPHWSPTQTGRLAFTPRPHTSGERWQKRTTKTVQ